MYDTVRRVVHTHAHTYNISHHTQVRTTTDKYESKESYGKKNGWKWQSQRELGTRTTRARHNRYPGSGFATELSPLSSLTEAAAVVADLREGGWVDLHTRAVFVNFALYNGNINEFLVGKVYFEFLPSGGVVPGFDFDVLNLSSYAGDRGRRLLVCEVVLVLFIIFYTAEEIKVGCCCVCVAVWLCDCVFV